jgi:hypothetical protein
MPHAAIALRLEAVAMSMIFEFKQMEQANAFIGAVNERFGLGGLGPFNDADEVYRHTLFPYVLHPPVVFIDRVCSDTVAEASAVKLRFRLTKRDIDRYRKKEVGRHPLNLESVIDILAERKVEKLAEEFGGEWVGTGPAAHNIAELYATGNLAALRRRRPSRTMIYKSAT